MFHSSVDAPVTNQGSMRIFSSSLSKKLSNTSSGVLFIKDSSIHALYLDNGSLEMHGGKVVGLYPGHDGYSVYLSQKNSSGTASVLLDDVHVALGLESAALSSGYSLTVQDSSFGGDICNAWSSVWKGASSCASVSSSGTMRLAKNSTLSVGDSVFLSTKNGDAVLCDVSVSDSSLMEAKKNASATLDHLVAEIRSAEFSLSSLSLSDSSLIMTAEHSSLSLSDTLLDASSSILGKASHPLAVSLAGVSLDLSGAKVLSVDSSLFSDNSALSSLYLFDLSSVFSNVSLSGCLQFDLSNVSFLQNDTDHSFALLFDLGCNTKTSPDFTWSATGLSLSETQNFYLLSDNTSIIPEPSVISLCLTAVAFFLPRRRR